MKHRIAVLTTILLSITAAGFAQAAASAHTFSPQQVVSKWQRAVRAGNSAPRSAAVLSSTVNEDGIPGKVEEWITAHGLYRRLVTREFDEAETVVTERWAKRRDWNGFVRDVEGEELSRLRTAIYENMVLALGPQAPPAGVTVSPGEDGKLLLLRLTPPGGKPLTWYVDTKTWLPAKSVRSGEDSEITSVYEDWREIGGIRVPTRVRVSETDKPDYQWEPTSLKFETALSSRRFAAPAPKPLDTHLEANAPPIPFNFESSHILLQAQLNGRAPIWFILDTGADQEVINGARLADFGLSVYAKSRTTGGGGSAEYDFSQNATFTWPGVEVRNQHVAVIDESGLERALGMPIGGILGYDFISRFVIEIDYEKKLLKLHDPQTWSYTGAGFIVPLTFDNGIPFVHGVISVPTKPNIPAFLVLDFGAAETMTLTSPFVKTNDLARLAQTNATVNRPAGLENQFFTQHNVRGRIDQLALGKMTVRSIPVNLSVNTVGAYASASFAGTVGESIYRRYHVFLDYARKRVIFEPTAEAGKPFPERQTYGLSVIASGADLHTFTVAGVRAGSPAEKDGFKKGDVVVGLDSRQAAQFTLGDLREQLSHAGERHALQIKRQDQQLTLPIEVNLVSLDAR